MTPELGWLLAGVATIVAVGFGAAWRRAAGLNAAFRPSRESVRVIVSCDRDPLTVRVDPWTVWVRQKKPLSWTLEAPAGTTMRIVPKDIARWPFREPPPKDGAPPGQEVRGGTVTGARGTIYRYSIEVTCGDQTLDIDPDIFICE